MTKGKMGRPKVLDDGVILSAMIEQRDKDKLSCLGAKLGADPSRLVRLALAALFEANPISPQELAAWRRQARKVSQSVPGLRKPRGPSAKLISLDEKRKKKMEPIGIEPTTYRDGLEAPSGHVALNGWIEGDHRDQIERAAS